MAMTYAQLSSAVQAYTENTESTFVTNIATFTAQAERRIYNSVNIPALRKRDTSIAMVSGTNTITMPSDWLATYSLAVVTPVTLAQTYLLNKDVEFIREAYPTSTATGTPVHYANLTTTATTATVLLGPTPNANYATELQYYYYPESIVTASTSWLGNNYEFVLLYGVLREAAIYMKSEPDMIENYEKKYLEALDLLQQAAEGKGRQDTYRVRQARVPVK